MVKPHERVNLKDHKTFKFRTLQEHEDVVPGIRESRHDLLEEFLGTHYIFGYHRDGELPVRTSEGWFKDVPTLREEHRVRLSKDLARGKAHIFRLKDGRVLVDSKRPEVNYGLRPSGHSGFERVSDSMTFEGGVKNQVLELNPGVGEEDPDFYTKANRRIFRVVHPSSSPIPSIWGLLIPHEFFSKAEHQDAVSSLMQSAMSKGLRSFRLIVPKEYLKDDK
ncbi:MAG: hypothetical protein GOV15_03795, partial [Candidatus Diapherotrites archaeon]|nr:hypothetical protein [Candidatus Diapherotrites archaeon]